MAQLPDLETVRAWIGAAPDDISDDQLQLILDSEIDVQQAYCSWEFAMWGADEIPDPLAQSLLRRCARAVAARGVPLGSLPAPSSGLGNQYGLPGGGLLPRFDAEIERLEHPYRLAGIA